MGAEVFRFIQVYSWCLYERILN